MKIKFLLTLSICIVIISTVYIINLLNQDFILNKDDDYNSTINVWITTPGLVSALKQFQTESNNRMNVREFKDTEALFEELELIDTDNNEYPNIVETDSNFGMEEISELGNIVPLSEVSKSLPDQFYHSVSLNFYHNDSLFAFPVGVEIPLVLINRTIINNQISTDLSLYPFASESQLVQYKRIQDKIDRNDNTKPFWFFHLDNNIPLYWNSYLYSHGNRDTHSFADMWKRLIVEYELVPPLDNHMAITRFANTEVGVLITTSQQLQTIQHLIGNSFEFEVLPFIQNNNDPILVSGNGLVVLKNSKHIKELFQFMSSDEIQTEILSKTGWFPTQKSLWDKPEILHELPMAKHLNSLLKYSGNFRGKKPTNNAKSEQIDIKKKAHKIESDY
ncbi:extracellular solute-binding protein [Oceanobacillus manasiensis]|uniref:extracellular solute-binding protein n=1 Tax=Oceanobacillus manasiensis TaxID=586413 RepID=UPI0005AB5745|nr:extracellular solute-binding protein [Oceanobacillus manasiensis]